MWEVALPRAARAELKVGIVLVGFNPDVVPGPAPTLLLGLAGSELPQGVVAPGERVADAMVRVASSAGVDISPGRRARRPQVYLLLASDALEPDRVLTLWHYCCVPADAMVPPGVWVEFSGSARITREPVVRAALARVMSEGRFLAGALQLLPDVFTSEDLFRLHVALHGVQAGSERTFRRRVQELRAGGIIVPVRENEVDTMRGHVPRFRSTPGTGGRPPELLRFLGGGEQELFSVLRSRRT